MAAEETKKKGGCLGKVGIAFVVLIVIGMIGGMLGGGDEPSDANTPDPTPQVQQNDTANEADDSNGADKSLLEGIVKNASGTDSSQWTEDSMAVLSAALDAAKAVLDDPAATQEQVDAARDAVTDAVSALVEVNAPTMGQENAIATAENYLSFMHFSRSGLIGQLEFEGYSTEDATFAVDYLDVDWNEQAAGCAQDYLDTMSFSRSGLIDQLEYEGFTKEQAEYGVTAVGY